ncbi:MAG: hypothetical protein HFH82_14045 [Lachnospiraceae bacterium]|nr:hypothetical protein [Lachnospiraceae bacterium]
MKHFLKGAAVAVVILIVLMAINIICSMNGIEFNSVCTGTVSGICGMFIYQRLIKNEKEKENANAM